VGLALNFLKDFGLHFKYLKNFDFWFKFDLRLIILKKKKPIVLKKSIL
jgi:hypothetical protein